MFHVLVGLSNADSAIVASAALHVQILQYVECAALATYRWQDKLHVVACLVPLRLYMYDHQPAIRSRKPYWPHLLHYTAQQQVHA